MSQPKTYPVRAADAERGLRPFSHTWNPKSQVDFFQLGGGVDLRAGRARHPEVDSVEHEVASGDFLGFPTPDVAHHLRNPFAHELVYLSGGENRPVPQAEFEDLPSVTEMTVLDEDRRGAILVERLRVLAGPDAIVDSPRLLMR